MSIVRTARSDLRVKGRNVQLSVVTLHRGPEGRNAYIRLATNNTRRVTACRWEELISSNSKRSSPQPASGACWPMKQLSRATSHGGRMHSYRVAGSYRGRVLPFAGEKGMSQQEPGFSGRFSDPLRYLLFTPSERMRRPTTLLKGLCGHALSFGAQSIQVEYKDRREWVIANKDRREGVHSQRRHLRQFWRGCVRGQHKSRAETRSVRCAVVHRKTRSISGVHLQLHEDPRPGSRRIGSGTLLPGFHRGRFTI
jgi:hypothetical protein